MARGCVISFFYIKPQLLRAEDKRKLVVLYLSSTSNHNCQDKNQQGEHVVLYLSSTSNHNCNTYTVYVNIVVLYLSSTSNHNGRFQ